MALVERDLKRTVEARQGLDSAPADARLNLLMAEALWGLDEFSGALSHGERALRSGVLNGDDEVRAFWVSGSTALALHRPLEAGLSPQRI